MDKLGCPDWVVAAPLAGHAAVPRRARRSSTWCARSDMRGPGCGRRQSCTCSARTRCTTSPGISVILLPWAGLPWMIALVARGARDTAGGSTRPCSPSSCRSSGASTPPRSCSRASRPLLWVPYSVCVTREVDVAARARHARAHRRAHAGRVAVVAGRAVGAGQFRAQHPPLHRDASKTVSTTPTAARQPARSRVLVLLRRRQVSVWIEASLDYTQHAGFIDRDELRGADPRVARCRVRALAPPLVLRRARR